MLDHVVAEAIGEDLAWQWGNSNACALAFEDIAEVLKVGVAAAHDGMFQLEGRDVGTADNFVRGIHVP